MGIIRMGPPRELISKLKEEFNLNVFIETGTFKGGTCRWASQVFEKVYTIEASKELYKETSEKLSNIDNISFIHGNSAEKIKDLLLNINSSPLIWLDAHYSGGETAGENIENPLLEEIRIINEHKPDSFIFIDDARIFLSPWVDPNTASYTPGISSIIIELNKIPNHYVVIIEDVIISVPARAKEIIKQYCIQITTKEWEEYGKRMRERKELSCDNNKANRRSWKSAFPVRFWKKLSSKK